MVGFPWRSSSRRVENCDVCRTSARALAPSSPNLQLLKSKFLNSPTLPNSRAFRRATTPSSSTKPCRLRSSRAGRCPDPKTWAKVLAPELWKTSFSLPTCNLVREGALPVPRAFAKAVKPSSPTPLSIR
ncbi:hypothetical protein Mapa_009527 [Marchantia paleacea]|nr:hypothetical protein Mapa_009527 [Marchantia paleacea]